VELGGSVKYGDSPKEVVSREGRELEGRTATSVGFEKTAEVRSIVRLNVGVAEVRRVVPC
jgi:hypothetical protein